MELRNLRTYCKVCETMSFSKAAEELGYAQSTITMQIGQLEEELGVSLFDRNGKRFRLNAKGQELLDYANRLIALADEAKSSVSDSRTPKGLLRIGVIESLQAFFLPDLLYEYMTAFPQVQVQVISATTREIMEMLRQNKIDLMLTLDEPLFDPDWKCAWSRKEKIVFLCPNEHPFAGRSLSLEEAACENFLLTEHGCNYRQSFEELCIKRRQPLRSSLEVGCTDMILDYTKRGLGISFLPQMTAQASLSLGELSSFEIDGAAIGMEIQLIHRRSVWCTPAMEKFVEIVQRKFIKSIA